MDQLYYYSTRDVKKTSPKTSAQVIKQGIADDGGLFMPESIPSVTRDELVSLCPLSYAERAAHILSKYLTDYTKEELLDAASAAYSKERFGESPAPVKTLFDAHRIVELWHGPTCAFKDMALQIMPHLLRMALQKTGETREAFILVATSGDTGKAALEGYADVPGVRIMVFYPEDGVSDMQKLQMTSQNGENVAVCAIKGNFDHAQAGVKQIFADQAIAAQLERGGLFLTSANSINWGRLAPQIVYYFSAYCDMAERGDITLGEQIDVTVPTGNFGNIFAAYLAKKMGLPIHTLVCASNKNNILTDFINTGIYDRNREFYTTMSPSMDILVSSNLERLLHTIAGGMKSTHYMRRLSQTGRYAVDKGIRDEIAGCFHAYFCGEEQCAKVIRQTFERHSYLADPHTAVALAASFQADAENKKQGRERKILTASTASPYKFAADVLRSLGKKDLPHSFAVLRALSEQTKTPIPSPLARLEHAAIRFSGSVEKGKDHLWEAAKGFLFSE